MMKRTHGFISLGAILGAIACSSGGTTQVTGPPDITLPASDTIKVGNPANPGMVHFNISRSTTSSIPEAATDALIRVSNVSANIDTILHTILPVVGTTTPISIQLPADTGYVIRVIAFHGGTMDAAGSTMDASTGQVGGDSTITVLPVGGPEPPPATEVKVQLVGVGSSFNLSNGDNIPAGESEPIIAFTGMPFGIWTAASC